MTSWVGQVFFSKLAIALLMPCFLSVYLNAQPPSLPFMFLICQQSESPQPRPCPLGVSWFQCACFHPSAQLAACCPHAPTPDFYLAPCKCSLLSDYYVLGTVPNTLCTWFHLVLSTLLWDLYRQNTYTSYYFLSISLMLGTGLTLYLR